MLTSDFPDFFISSCFGTLVDESCVWIVGVDGFGCGWTVIFIGEGCCTEYGFEVAFKV
jgi:hypothetical protein